MNKGVSRTGSRCTTPTAEPISLGGWYLTDNADNLTRWQFPDIQLGAGDYRVVFASGDNLVDPAGPLHTDFRLNGGGEFLALVRPRRANG